MPNYISTEELRERKAAINDVKKIEILNEDATGFPIGKYEISSTDDLGVGFFIVPVENESSNVLHIFKYMLNRFKNKGFIRVLA